MKRNKRVSQIVEETIQSLLNDKEAMRELADELFEGIKTLEQHDELVQAIYKYQHDPAKHPLTCGKEPRCQPGGHSPLYAYPKDGHIILKCSNLDCDYTQEIPEWFREMILSK